MITVKSCCKTGALLSLLFFVLAILSINFIDKPLALYIHAHGFDQWSVLSYLTERGILALIVFSCIMLAIFPSDKLLWKRICFLIFAVIGAYVAIWMRRKLGVACARSWPLPWSGSGVYGSLIIDNHFGFHFLQSSSWKGSFPSGHNTEVAYISCIMYLAYHRYKYIWCIPLALMMTCQVLQNFHYLGDCLAGVSLGLLVAYYFYAGYLWLVSFRKN